MLHSHHYLQQPPRQQCIGKLKSLREAPFRAALCRAMPHSCVERQIPQPPTGTTATTQSSTYTSSSSKLGRQQKKTRPAHDVNPAAFFRQCLPIASDARCEYIVKEIKSSSFARDLPFVLSKAVAVELPLFEAKIFVTKCSAPVDSLLTRYRAPVVTKIITSQNTPASNSLSRNVMTLLRPFHPCCHAFRIRFACHPYRGPFQRPHNSHRGLFQRPHKSLGINWHISSSVSIRTILSTCCSARAAR